MDPLVAGRLWHQKTPTQVSAPIVPNRIESRGVATLATRTPARYITRMLRELRLLLPYLKQYRLAYLLGGCCILGSVALKLLIPYLLGDAIDALRELAAAEPPIGSGADPNLTGLLARSAITIVLTAASVALLRTISRLLILGSSRKVVHDVRNVVFDHLLRLAPSFYVRNPTGQIMSRCINDMQNVQRLMGPVIMYLAETTILFAFGLAMMLRINPTLTLIGILPFPPFLFLARRLAVRIQEGSRQAQNALAEVSAKVDESLSGQLVIKTLTLEEDDRRRFHSRCTDYRNLNLSITRTRAVLIPLMMGLTSLSTVIVLAVGGQRAMHGELSIGSVVTMMLYLQMLSGPTRILSFIIGALRRGAAALGRIREILDAPPTLREPPTAAAAGVERGEIRVDQLSVVFPPLAEQPHLSGSLPEMEPEAAADPEVPEVASEAANRAREATVRAEEQAASSDDVPVLRTAAPTPNGSNGARRVLDDISFTVPAGTTLGIVGHTGSGKTTLVRAIARQLEVEAGQVFIDGTDVTHLGLAAVRRSIGFVPQDAFLFSASLADNVALGRHDAPPDAIATAVAAAQLTPDLAQLPEGLDTIVGERGVMLSGGQRQRTALARVLLLDPRILILDDTLSAVDTGTADEILAGLRPFSARRSTIIVAHRLSTVQDADNIIVLDEGRIAEQGDHEHLIALGGRYAKLYAWQQQHEARAAELGLAPDAAGPGRKV